MLSINPDAATRDDVARMAFELREANRLVHELCLALDAISIRYRDSHPDTPMSVAIDGLLDHAGYDRSEGEKL